MCASRHNWDTLKYVKDVYLMTLAELIKKKSKIIDYGNILF